MYDLPRDDLGGADDDGVLLEVLEVEIVDVVGVGIPVEWVTRGVLAVEAEEGIVVKRLGLAIDGVAQCEASVYLELFLRKLYHVVRAVEVEGCGLVEMVGHVDVRVGLGLGDQGLLVDGDRLDEGAVQQAVGIVGLVLLAAEHEAVFYDADVHIAERDVVGWHFGVVDIQSEAHFRHQVVEGEVHVAHAPAVVVCVDFQRSGHVALQHVEVAVAAVDVFAHALDFGDEARLAVFEVLVVLTLQEGLCAEDTVAATEVEAESAGFEVCILQIRGAGTEVVGIGREVPVVQVLVAHVVVGPSLGCARMVSHLVICHYGQRGDVVAIEALPARHLESVFKVDGTCGVLHICAEGARGAEAHRVVVSGDVVNLLQRLVGRACGHHQQRRGEYEEAIIHYIYYM